MNASHLLFVGFLLRPGGLFIVMWVVGVVRTGGSVHCFSSEDGISLEVSLVRMIRRSSSYDSKTYDINGESLWDFR